MTRQFITTIFLLIDCSLKLQVGFSWLIARAT
jgi:hypothetical protein